MVVSNDRNGINEINTWPEEVEAKLIELQDGDIVKVRLNPTLWFTVLEQRGTSQDYSRPTSSGMVKKIGQHGIPSPWTIRWNRQPFQVGFLEGYDTNGVARYAHPLFNEQGEMTFNGDRVGDRERFFVIQLHPQMRIDPLSGLERRNWKFEIVDAEKESTGITQNFEAKLALLNKIKDLNEQSLNTLMKPMVYGRSFYGKSDLVGKPKAARAILVKQVEEGRLKEVNDTLKSLDEVNKIGLVYDGLVAKKLICTETKLLRYDGLEICTFAEEISIPNMEEAAINIFKYASHLPVFEEKVVEFLRENYEGAKSTVHKARRGVKGEE
jgi:hypothetical protein